MENKLSAIVGHTITGKVTDENEKYYIISVSGNSFRLDKTEIVKSLKLGSQFKGFAYKNDHHYLQITRNKPKINIDHYDYGSVVRIQKSLGVFINIGLSNKDVVLSLDNLPEMMHLWPQIGDRIMITLRVDKKARLWAIPADESIFREISQLPKYNQLKNNDIKVTAYQLKLTGTKVVSDECYLGFIPYEERQEEPRLGQYLTARVIGQFSDATLKLSLRPRSYESISKDAAMILATLQHNTDGKIAFDDKSDPNVIKKYFGISKGQFKRAVGHLMKEHLITQHDGFLWLTK